jgi:hypothetical protein
VAAVVAISVSAPCRVDRRELAIRIDEVGLNATRTDDRLTRRDPAGDTPGMVGEKHAARAHAVGIVLAAGESGGEAVADLHALDRVDSHAGGGEFGVELGVNGRAPAGRNAGRDALHHSAERGARRARRRPASPTALPRAIGAEEGVLVDRRVVEAIRSMPSPPSATR